MKTLITRTLTGAIFLIIVIGSIFSGPYLFTLLSFVFMIIGLNEFTKLKPDFFLKKNTRFLFYLSGIIVFYMITLPVLGILPTNISIWGTALILACLILALINKPKKPINFLLNFSFAYIYVSIPFALLATFHFLNDLKIEDHELLLGFFIILWSNDVFAYLVGSTIGKTKLAERISPKKTWEGTIGGIILSMLAAYLISNYFFSLDLENWLVLGLLISIFATLGDLLESWFKRQAGVKDSGKLMPGHGGVLDRFDGMILAAPIVYIYLSIVL